MYLLEGKYFIKVSKYQLPRICENEFLSNKIDDYKDLLQNNLLNFLNGISLKLRKSIFEKVIKSSKHVELKQLETFNICY